MKGVSFITDETHKKRYVQLDIEQVSKKSGDELEDLLDIIIAEARKYDPRVPLNEVVKRLKKRQESFKDFAGVWTKKEAEDMEKIIEESCEVINPDDWK